MRRLLIPLVLFVFTIRPAFAGALPDAAHLVVIGECEIRATPDILTLSLSISETGFEVAAARESVESRSKKLLQDLLALGVAKEDIGSAQLQITPHYNWDNTGQIYAGTEVSRIVEVTLRDLGRYDQLIRSIIDARVAQIQSTVLGSSKEKKLREDALRGAIDDGTAKARIMVGLLPAALGPVYSISPQSSAAPVFEARYGAADMATKQSAFEPGTIVLRESLQLVFYLKNKE